MRAKVAAVLTLAGLLAGPCFGQPFFRSETRRTVVTAITVQGGIGVPVTTVVTSGFRIGPRPFRPTRSLDPVWSRGYRYTYLIRRPVARRPVLAFSSRRSEKKSGASRTTVFGVIELSEEGRYIARVRKGAREIVYDLQLPEMVQDEIESASTDAVRAIIVGKPSPAGDSPPLFRVDYVMVQEASEPAP